MYESSNLITTPTTSIKQIRRCKQAKPTSNYFADIYGAFQTCGAHISEKNGRILYSTCDVELFQQMMELHEKGFGTIPECVYNVVNINRNVVNSSNNSEDTMDKQSKQIKQPQDTSSLIDTVDEIARIREEMEELRKYVDESIKKEMSCCYKHYGKYWMLNKRSKKRNDGGNYGSKPTIPNPFPNWKRFFRRYPSKLVQTFEIDESVHSLHRKERSVRYHGQIQCVHHNCLIVGTNDFLSF